VYSRSGSEYSVKQVESAVNTIKNLLSSAGVTFHDVVVSGMDFVGDVAAIVKALRDYAKDAAEIVATVTGGMRLTVVEVIVALQLYKALIRGDADVRIYVAREDGLYDVFIPIDLISSKQLEKTERRDLEILKFLDDSMKLSDAVEAISEKLGVSKHASYRYLYRLKKRNLIAFEDHVIKLTLAGRLIKGVIQ